MNLLLDTYVLLWAAGLPDRLPAKARSLLEDAGNQLLFSPISLWEVTIKQELGRPDFKADPHVLRRGLIDNGWVEVPVTSLHAVAVAQLPPIHKDPFDRMLLAQAQVEGVTLVTADRTVADYPGSVALV